MGILTQYIGPPIEHLPDLAAKPTTTRPASWTRKPKSSKNHSWRKLTNWTIKGHHVALTRALAQDRLPAKLRIQNKPIVMDNDNPKFQQGG